MDAKVVTSYDLPQIKSYDQQNDFWISPQTIQTD